MYDCSREESIFIIVGRGRDLFMFEFLAVFEQGTNTK